MSQEVHIHPALTNTQLQRCHMFARTMELQPTWEQSFVKLGAKKVAIGRLHEDGKFEEPTEVEPNTFLRGMRFVHFSLYKTLMQDPATADVVQDIIQQHRAL